MDLVATSWNRSDIIEHFVAFVFSVATGRQVRDLCDQNGRNEYKARLGHQVHEELMAVP